VLLTGFYEEEVRPEMSSSLATENLYLAAYEVCEGAALKGVQVSRANGRSTVVFALEGPAVQRIADAFWAGTAVVNLADYRRHLEGLKGELFAAMKKTETERRDRDERPRRRHARL
jgi:hypothetical protein